MIESLRKVALYSKLGKKKHWERSVTMILFFEKLIIHVFMCSKLDTILLPKYIYIYICKGLFYFTIKRTESLTLKKMLSEINAGLRSTILHIPC